ncbi:MAG: hypothetical protein JJ863_01585 [Deltaproteobacteria bacterium]|nr:hypothetical protein [Deltaproteobacteria bacterium]
MRCLSLLLCSTMGCAAAAPTPTATPVAEAPLPSPLPAGRWAAERTERTSCIDCPSPRVAVVLATGSLEEVTAQPWSDLGPGYPMLVADGELGLSLGAEVGVVAGLYADEGEGEAVALRLGGRSVTLVDDPPLGETSIVTTTDRVEAKLEPNGATACVVEAGRHVVLRRSELVRRADETWWVPVTCGDEPAFVPVTSTDLDRTTLLRDGRVRTIQPISGVCGLLFYRERREGSDGQWSERELSSDPSCVAELDPSDQWAVCPEDGLESCVQRASRIGDRDPRHAERLMSYACRFGNLEGCTRLVAMNADRGLGLLWGWCHGEHLDSCERLDAALRATDPATLEGHAGGLELYACERGLEPWCERLDASDVCDRQGCG